MAITGYGVAGSIGVAQWQQLCGDMVRSYVPTGMVVSAKASSIRTVTVTAGRAYGAGSETISDTSVDIALSSNTSGTSRIDLIVVRIDFAQPPETAFSIVAKTGSSPTTAPALSRVNGGVWEIPLARVTVANAAGQLTSGNIVDARPLNPERTWSGQAVITIPSGGGVGTTTVKFPIGCYFSDAPNVTVSSNTGAAAGTNSNEWVNTITPTTCNISASRTTGTDVTVTWRASVPAA